MALENQIRSTNHCRRAVGRSDSLEAAIHSVIHRGYYQIQRYTQAGMGDYSLTNFEFKWDDRAVKKNKVPLPIKQQPLSHYCGGTKKLFYYECEIFKSP